MLSVAGLFFLGSAWACGPFYPHTLLGSGPGAMTSGPYADLSVELARMGVQAPAGAVGTSTPRDVAEQADAARELGSEPHRLAVARFRSALAQARRGRGPVPEVPEGLPEPWHLYLEGARAMAVDDVERALAAFDAVAALPEATAGSRGLWALHMIGRLRGDVDALREVRRRVAAGAPDPLGVGASGLGWEARFAWDAGDVAGSTRLYLEQHAAGDPTARQSVDWLVRRTLADPERRARALADPLTTRVVTAWLVTGAGSDEQASAWLSELPSADVPPEHEAWLAWLVRDLDRLDGALADAAASPMTRWLAARRAVLAGDLDAALGLLEQADFDAEEAWQCRWYSRGDWEGPAQIRPAAETQSELGALRLRAGDTVGALRAFAVAGHWFDTAHVAERVVSVDTLQSQVEADLLALLPEAQRPPMRDLLARRLFRAGDLVGAQRYARPEHAARIRRFADLRDDGTAPALWEAARLLRFEGLELAGTELAPDFAWSGGSLPPLPLRSWAGTDAPHSPTPQEVERVAATAPEPDRRFHYRYQAAELAWQAAERIPSGHPDAPRVLCQAGRWIMHRDPQAADRYYKAMVWRGWGTPLAATADALRWFPDAEACALETVSVDEPPPWWGWAKLAEWWEGLTGAGDGAR